MRNQKPRWRGSRFVALAGSVTLMGGLSVAAVSAPGYAAGQRHTAAAAPDRGCRLDGGRVKHVIELIFDNVHFFRDNPNVPSDLEMMPHLLQFLENNGTLASNNHTPLIAHTADDSLTTYTGLYGDRQGMPVSNSYQAYNADGTTDPAGSFAYWTDPVFDTASTPIAGHDTNPSMVYSSTPPATTKPAPAPDTTTPAPWVPFTRAGCDVGDVSTANMVLENTAVDIPKVFGQGSPEDAAAHRRHRLLQGRRDGRLRRRRGALRPRQRLLLHGHRSEVRADQPVAHRGCRPAARRARRIPRLPGAVRPQVHRAAARGRHAEPHPQRLPGHERRREPRRPQREPDQRRLPHQSPGLPRLRPHQRRADPGLQRGHAGIRRCPSSTGTSRTSTATNTSTA